MIFFNYVTVKGNTEELYDFLNEIKTSQTFSESSFASALIKFGC